MLDKYIGRMINEDALERDSRFSFDGDVLSYYYSHVDSDGNETVYSVSFLVDEDDIITELIEASVKTLVGEDATYCEYKEEDFEDYEEDFCMEMDDMMVECCCCDDFAQVITYEDGEETPVCLKCLEEYKDEWDK